jgi:hypothetical protein
MAKLLNTAMLRVPSGVHLWKTIGSALCRRGAVMVSRLWPCPVVADVHAARTPSHAEQSADFAEIGPDILRNETPWIGGFCASDCCRASASLWCSQNGVGRTHFENTERVLSRGSRQKKKTAGPPLGALRKSRLVFLNGFVRNSSRFSYKKLDNCGSHLIRF